MFSGAAGATHGLNKTGRSPSAVLLGRAQRCHHRIYYFSTTFKSSGIHLPSHWDLATLPNKSFVS